VGPEGGRPLWTLTGGDQEARPELRTGRCERAQVDRATRSSLISWSVRPITPSATTATAALKPSQTTVVGSNTRLPTTVQAPITTVTTLSARCVADRSVSSVAVGDRDDGNAACKRQPRVEAGPEGLECDDLEARDDGEQEVRQVAGAQRPLPFGRHAQVRRTYCACYGCRARHRLSCER
jgi:hypothetical protein